MHGPKVLILDEPTSGLDPLQIRDVRELIGALAHDRAIIVSTHILPEVQVLATRIMILHQGRVAHDAPVDAASGRLLVRFQDSSHPEFLDAIAGVRDARSNGGGRWELAVDDCERVAREVAERAAAEGFRLVELQPNYNALEHLFMRLTAGDETAEESA